MRVNVGAGGVEANDDSSFPTFSSEGRYVAFRSLASNLVAGDTNEENDIFVHDLLGGQQPSPGPGSAGSVVSTGAIGIAIGLFLSFSVTGGLVWFVLRQKDR